MKRLILLLTPVAIITVVFGTIYAAVQQSIRLATNEPLIAQAEQMAARLDAGGSTQVEQGGMDISKDLQPFVAIYDKQYNAVNSDAYFHERLPQVPKGVLQAANTKEYNAVTWQPANGVRIATVTVPARNYYVLVGQNLRLVERREERVALIALAGWLASMLVAVVVAALAYKRQA